MEYDRIYVDENNVVTIGKFEIWAFYAHFIVS